ncbi:MAG: hypothetical protein DI533_04745 [Cereibacter sphaeroides]|uniref:Uncharacterized protein n=1 Tax=Cereibacter sphaeroides TaxID=1063 RepID=A0A2W5SA86_CERSP|nr:MAG: hypothetical protein DI533_04745 [Cereibacter sphaeroides]
MPKGPVLFGLPSPFAGRRRYGKAKSTVPPVLDASSPHGLSTGSWTGSNGTYQRRYLNNGAIISGATGATFNSSGYSGNLVGQVRTFDANGRPSRWVSSNEVTLSTAGAFSTAFSSAFERAA